ncbi:MAG: lysophospholipid acyltransferase family protein [Eubacteriales bacterium]|nr:lysophospholipid acyltransferase family protein [Eubacteriales bacterium]
MAFIQNLPGALRFLGTIRRFKKKHVEIDRARESGNPAEEQAAIASAVSAWSLDAARTMRLELKISGTENIPKENGFLVVANHQSYADILAVLRAVDGHQLGFIAKDNLKKVPYVGYWIEEIRGLFLHRGDAKAAVKMIQEGSKLLKDGYNLCIFPEGTRSWGPETGEFKGGSFKLATKSKRPILPIAINGTYHFFEENKRIRPAKATVEILSPVFLEGLNRKEQAEKEKEIYQKIREAVSKMDQNDPMKAR